MIKNQNYNFAVRMGTEKRKVKYISRKRQEIPKETQIVTQFYQEAGKINYTIITRRVNFFNTKTARREVKYVEIRCLFPITFQSFTVCIVTVSFQSTAKWIAGQMMT